MPTLPSALGHWLRTLVAGALIAAPTLYLVHMWLGYREPWLHPELLGTSHYVWNLQDREGFADRIRKVFDWKAFDPNVNRVRPLNDVAEVVDALARPYLARLFFPHPSLTPVGIITAVLSPLLLFRYLRGCGLDTLRAAALVATFLSSVGFCR